METFAQILSIAGLACVVASYQQKKKSALIAVQATGGALFAVHYLMLGAYAGFLLNTIAVFRGIVFYKERSGKSGKIWVGVISALCVLAYVLTFVAFGTPPTLGNLILESLPTIGMVVLTISFNMTHAGQIRALGFINSAGWLTYNIAHLSIGGIGCEIMCVISIIIGILRHDIKNKTK